MTISHVHGAPSAVEIMSTPVLTFRWQYVVLPCLVLVLSLALAVGCYGRLPPSVAYHFAAGAPDLWAGRPAVLAVLLVPQFIGTMAAFALTWAVIMLGRRYQGHSSGTTRGVRHRARLHDRRHSADGRDAARHPAGPPAFPMGRRFHLDPRRHAAYNEVRCSCEGARETTWGCRWSS